MQQQQFYIISTGENMACEFSFSMSISFPHASQMPLAALRIIVIMEV